MYTWKTSKWKYDKERNKKFWEGLITYFPLIQHTPHRKWHVQQFFYCCMCDQCHGNVFNKQLPSNLATAYEWLGGILLLFVSIHCRRNVFTELLPSNDGGGMHIQTHRQLGYLITLLSLYWKNNTRLMWLPYCLFVPLNARKLEYGSQKRQSSEYLTNTCYIWHNAWKAGIGQIRFKSLWRWYSNTNIMFLDIIIVLFLFKTQCFGDCMLSPSSGKTYSVGSNRWS
jgi:hypothetical protein